MDLPTIAHIIYIPAVFAVGIVLGWTLRSRAQVKDEYEE